MNYKYQRGQLFRKKLNVPKNILNKVYDSTLSLNEFIEYNLDDKIPISCVREADREIIEKFGIDRCKKLDWELINKRVYYNRNVNFRDALMFIDPHTEDINGDLYKLVKNQLKPIDYSEKMKEVYSGRLLDVSESDDANLTHLKNAFNEGEVSLKDIVCNWNLFKDKDLSYCLLKDDANKEHITNAKLKDFMNSYGNLSDLIVDHNDIYEFVDNVSSLTSDEEKKGFIKKFTDNILDEAYKNQENYEQGTKLTNDQYKEIFKYSSITDYLKKVSYTNVESLTKELETLPQDYVFNTSISFSTLLNPNVLLFVETYGLENVVDFDNECGHFFTKNNCEMLNSMYDMYLHYAGNTLDPERTLFPKNTYTDGPYTKDEFYEVMKRMIIYGPTDFNYADKAPDYREITGEFRTRNSELFISERAPEELQKLFYTKSITPQYILEHPEYAEYLRGKDLSSCFEEIGVKIEGKKTSFGYENFYKFLEGKTDFDGFMNFITEYNDALNIIFDKDVVKDYQYEVEFSPNDDMDQISNKIDEILRKVIIEKNTPYPSRIPKHMIENYPSMFLNKDAPKELKEAFYNRTISTESILSNPSYREFLRGVDLELLFRYMPVSAINDDYNYKQINLVSGVKQLFGPDKAFDVMLSYNKYLEQIFNDNKLNNFRFNQNFTQNDLLNEIDRTILQNIIAGKIKYDENIPEHFKENNPTLFLDENVPQEIRNKFYNREFTLDDFNNNPELFQWFDNTNIACGFPEDLSWVIQMFNNTDDIKTANYNRIKVISEYSKIQDVELQKLFKEYTLELDTNIDIEKIEDVSKLLLRFMYSNSSEIFTFRKELATQILKSDDPLKYLNKVEEVFLKNNIPTVGKIYSCFEILHPDFNGFNFGENSTVSPTLKNSSTMGKKVIVFSDLIKSSFGSNNRSVNSYLKNIEFGCNLYEKIKSGQVQFDFLDNTDKKQLEVFSNHLATLYNNTMRAKQEHEMFISSGDILNDIKELSRKLSPDGTLDYNLGDRVVRMFCGFTGIDTLERAKEYIEEKIQTADLRNRKASNSDMVLEQGDFVKGIGDITYLRNILQNGSISKEYLGSSAGSDATPLDTDVSMIMSQDGTIAEKIDKTIAEGYGPIWFVLKNDDRFVVTRTNDETLETERDLSKMEAFYTGVMGPGHYGIRTGFASSEIDYIVSEEYDPKIGLEIAMNGFYIPVANKEGKIIFTPKDYDELRAKMNGLSYFDEDNYVFSENLVTEETECLAQQIEQSNLEVQTKREKINHIIKDSLEDLGLHLKTDIDGDLTEGYVELIDTGSTGRETNKPGDGDFDFMMRLDKNILSDPSKLTELKQTILKKLGKENSSELTGSGDFRLKNVQIDNDTNVDIDITFAEKTDKVTYSTDMALKDRLTTIKKNDPEKYKYVVANILLAKEVLKEAGVYKPNRGETPQGGLGGVGIENWILQNGGSFVDAAKSFVDASEGKSFSEFQSTYQIWDFGDNHLAERRGQYPHDNFVVSNMSAEGYQKMSNVLKGYLKSMEAEQTQTAGIKR